MSIFSKIIAREIPARVVYEDEQVIAFLDINPVSLGHTLVVPKHEAPNVLESSEEDLHALMSVVRKLAPAIINAVGADGFNLVSNTGVAAGQSVSHTHFHIIPRFEGDGHKSWATLSPSDEEFDEVLVAIMSRL